MKERGVATGFCDSAGKPIHVGDIVRREVTGNIDFHGKWSDYKITQQGIAPLLSYVASESGQVLPEGYTGCWLTSCYDNKLAWFSVQPNRLKPIERMLVVDANLKWDDTATDE